MALCGSCFRWCGRHLMGGKRQCAVVCVYYRQTQVYCSMSRSCSSSLSKAVFRSCQKVEEQFLFSHNSSAVNGRRRPQIQPFRRIHLTSQVHGDVIRGIPSFSDEGADHENLLEDAKYREFMREYFSIPDTGQQIFVIQPDIKWGPRKAALTTPELQLAEACALVQSLPDWKVVDTMICRTKSLGTRYVFGTGMLEEVTRRVVGRNDVSAVFLSINMMTGLQLSTLQNRWRVPVFDRYSVVLEIFKEHAKSKEAKLQVALAEIPYIRTRLKGFHDGTIARSSGGMQHIGGSGETFLELRQRLLQERELKLKKALDAVKDQRKLLRKNRGKKEFPVVAVVGYTNAGKTSLIKAVTGDSSMAPRDELFATLDVTSHTGYLPSRVPALFVDTVGFMSDIPTTLIDAFSATLEDALSADVIVHVRDASHPDTKAQRHNVLTTLGGLLTQEQLYRVIEVGNKADLLPRESVSESGLLVSATSGTGLSQLLERVETAALKATGKTHRRLSVPIGGPHLRWLHSEATVIDAEPTEDSQHLIVHVVISEAAYAKFRAQFGRPKRRDGR